MSYQGDQLANMMNNDFNFELTAEDLAYQGDSGLYSLPDDTSGLAFDDNFNLTTQPTTAVPQIPAPLEGAMLAPHNPFQGAVGKSPQVNNGNPAYNHLTLPMPQFVPPTTFVPQPELPMPQAYAPGQPPIPVPHRAEAATHGVNGFPTSRTPVHRPEIAPITPSRPPSTTCVETWKWFRSFPERQNMDLKKTPITRITRAKKNGDGVDPRHTFDAKDYYGPPVDPPAPWGPKDPRTGQPIFTYTTYGELSLSRQYTTSELKQYLYAQPLKKAGPDDFVPRTRPRTERRVPGKKREGLTLWLGWPPSQISYRYPRPGTVCCRAKNCPSPTIRQGQPRVIFDERMNDEGLEIDPFHNAGYIHLHCLEKNFDLVELIRDLDFRLDERMFKKEEDNFFKLSGRDGKEKLHYAFKNWWRHQCANYQKAQAQGKSRDRSNFELTSLTSALLFTKMRHETTARSRTREKRNGIDITKYWGDLELLVQLQQNRDDKRRDSQASIPQRATAVPTAPSPFSDEDREDPRLFSPPAQEPDYTQVQQQQHGDYGMPMPNPSAIQVPLAHQATQCNMEVLNSPYSTAIPPTVDQWGQPHQQQAPSQHAQQPNMVPYQQQWMPQQAPVMASQGQKRDLGHVLAEDQNLGMFAGPAPVVTSPKRARCDNATFQPQNPQYQQQFQYPQFPGPAITMPVPQQGNPAGAAALQSWEAAQQYQPQQAQQQAQQLQQQQETWGNDGVLLGLDLDQFGGNSQGFDLDFNDPAFLAQVDAAQVDLTQVDVAQQPQEPQPQESQQQEPQQQEPQPRSGSKSPSVQGEFRAFEAEENTAGLELSPSQKFAEIGAVQWDNDDIFWAVDTGDQDSFDGSGDPFAAQMGADELNALFGGESNTSPQVPSAPVSPFSNSPSSLPRSTENVRETTTPVNSPPHSPWQSPQVATSVHGSPFAAASNSLPRSPCNNSGTPANSPPHSPWNSKRSLAALNTPPRSPSNNSGTPANSPPHSPWRSPRVATSVRSSPSVAASNSPPRSPCNNSETPASSPPHSPWNSKASVVALNTPPKSPVNKASATPVNSAPGSPSVARRTPPTTPLRSPSASSQKSSGGLSASRWA